MNIPMTLVRPDWGVIEATTALKYLRATREGLRVDAQTLQEKFLTHGNGTAQSAILVLSNEIALLDQVIQKLWVALGNPVKPP